MFEGGSLARMVFEEKGVVLVDVAGDATPDLDNYVEVAIEAGAEDVTLEEDDEGGKVLQVSKEKDFHHQVSPACSGIKDAMLQSLGK